ncbi:Minor fimbrial protein prsF precursor [Serratia fonticola]|uniref:fimbrial protein n=1 Tax=Serratia fonticola TaxID=47917 RepID=UPI0021795C54|nr:fimbrial protein [Serratia fonticola]CAI0837076.1 Minor fimbrial protein prsF precursor [Serratia fonticola]CAI0987047.1 Minor fimbrial protein prsF precursor [Serratia fonticola]CAI1699660.1 Minor fimbrial protein prsF precursor [Serratia fonticola]
MRQNGRRYWRYGLLSLALGCMAVQADVPVTVKATIVVPACSVTSESGEARLEVPFGEINVQDAGSAKAEKSVRIKVSCSGGAPAGKSLKMYLSPTAYGVMNTMGTNVLGTSLPGVGIALSRENMAFTIGQWLPIQVGMFTLTGRVVIQDEMGEEGGVFSATASLFASYI